MVGESTHKTVPLLIKDGRLIDPSQGLDKIGNLLIAEGKISWWGSGSPPMPYFQYVTISAEGMIVCPGFIDIHCHLREPGFEDKETIATGTRAAARGGFTTVCCMANTEPPIDQPAVVELIQNKAILEGVAHVFPIGCVSQGRKGKVLADMTGLAEAGVVAFSDDGSPVMDSKLMHLALEKGRQWGLPIIDHCEHPALSKGGVMNEGMMANKLGLKGIPAEAEEIMVARDIDLAERTGGRLHIAHVSTANSLALIQDAKKKGIPVTAEVTPHHLTLTEESIIKYGTNAKVNPPLRTEKDIAALIQGVREGVIDAIATDHAPHSIADKGRDFQTAAFGISGLETALGVLVSLVHEGNLDLITLISKLTAGPARVIGKHGLGTLTIGDRADVTIFDPEVEWIVDTGQFASKGKNTPWAGQTLKGKVMVTIVGGKIVYQHNTIKIDGMIEEAGLAPQVQLKMQGKP